MPCRAPPLRDSDLCIAHDHRPEIVQQRREALRRGGKAKLREGLEGWSYIDIDKVEDLRPLLSRSINMVGSGKMHPSVANAISGLAGQYAKVVEISDLEKRIGALEQKAQELKH